MTASTDFPSLPLVCLDTANDTSTTEVLRGKNTVVDFWTTRCTRCPAALDKLQGLASNDDRYANVQFISICCDELDGAREIIEKDDDKKWQAVHHYFMSVEDKERAKQVFGFKAVPFYVLVNEHGEITQAGNKVDWERVPGMIPDQENVIIMNTTAASVQEKQFDAPVVSKQEPAFILDDLDF